MTLISIRRALRLAGAVGLMTAGCTGAKDQGALKTASKQSLLSTAETIEKSLMIIDPSVVDSPAASSRLDDPGSSGLGAFSFGHMMQSLAGPQNPSAFAEAFLTQLATRQVVNGFVTEPTLSVFRSPPEDNEALTALNRWCRTPDGQLDLARAPFRLLAVVNRPDLRETGEELGELRFIYSLLMTDDACQTNSSPGTLPEVQSGTGVAVIFEFAQPATACSSARSLAARWQSLAGMSFGPDYLDALQTLTEGVLNHRNSALPNSSQLNHLRVNTGKSPSDWTLREFVLGGSNPSLTGTNQLRLVPPSGVPDFAAFNDTAELRSFVAQNRTAIENGTFMLKAAPGVFASRSFGGAQSNVLNQWNNLGVRDATFAFQTCGGCHTHSANGPHVGVNPPFPALVGRVRGQRARLSQFLLSFDGSNGELPARVKTLNDIASSASCATVDAFTVLSSFAPRDASPGDQLLINAISSPTPFSARQLRLHRVGDAIDAAPISIVDIDPPVAPQWRLCAPEGGTCTFEGTKTVRYGAGTRFVTRSMTSGTACTNDIFGDPIWGVAKSCWADEASAAPPAPTSGTWVACASENAFCAFTGTRRVRYGAEPGFSIVVVTGGTPCTNAVFGDPLFGVVKSCSFEADAAAVKGSGLATLNMHAPVAVGTYEVRTYDGAMLIATSQPLNVDVNHRFGLASSTFVPAASALPVSWSAPTEHSPDDVIGLYAPGAGNSAPIATFVTGAGVGFDNVSVNGFMTLSVPAQPGTYELRMLRAPLNVLVAAQVITVH